ncbi:uncharacterized protein LOC128661761 [Bombina bombina]|uniref:uncharacterized protein LOC128661761 n=1 Tax=Bombina bombina TaxID=8345 RepID=UPI00235AEFD0|nr:uncharacterized protein LOC128661761 [Bombina bombina]
MGIPGLAGLLRENASDCIQQRELSHYRGYVLAIDISVTVHQFLTGKPQLTNREGDDISVLKGLFDRTVHLLEHGIKPVYVFDGQPPKMKRPKPCSQGSASGQRRIASGAFPETHVNDPPLNV